MKTHERDEWSGLRSLSPHLGVLLVMVKKDVAKKSWNGLLERMHVEPNTACDSVAIVVQMATWPFGSLQSQTELPESDRPMAESGKPWSLSPG